MVEIVCVLYAKSTTVFIWAQLVRFGCEIFDFPEQSLVLSKWVEIDSHRLRLAAHVLKFLLYVVLRLFLHLWRGGGLVHALSIRNEISEIRWGGHDFFHVIARVNQAEFLKNQRVPLHQFVEKEGWVELFFDVCDLSSILERKIVTLIKRIVYYFFYWIWGQQKARIMHVFIV